MISQVEELCSELSAAQRAGFEGVEGRIFDIQRYSLHDGPGLRTNVFFKGCPLSCGWCSNPESQHGQPEVAVFAVNCIRCGQFPEACPDRWQADDDAETRRLVRAEYGARVALCPGGGVRMVGDRATAGSVIAEVLKDQVFYEGKGGLTLTGGEPTQQPHFAEALLRLARAEYVNTAMETCGYCPMATLERLAPYLDTILFDIKHLDEATHRAYTSVSNAPILANLRRLAEMGAPVIARLPLIPGFNADDGAVRAIGEFVAGLPGRITEIDLLPYHTLGRGKYVALARHYPWQDRPRLTDEQVEAFAGTLRELGLTVNVGG
jgi:pyruvate formate lyase activating enzyme